MKNTWPIWLSLLLLSGCFEESQPPRELINSYSRPLTEQELQAEADERDAEIIAQSSDQEETFVILGTDEKIWHGSFNAIAYEYDDQTSDTSINSSLYRLSRNPQAKVSIYRGETFQWNNQVKESRKGHIVIVINDIEIQKELKKIRFIFQDESQIITPITEKKGVYFTYDALKNCIGLELLSSTDNVLYSKEF